jgi:uncharacterized protein YegP (UPF0339 family)
MGLFSKKNKSETPGDFAIGLDPAKPGADKTVVRRQRRARIVVYFAEDGWRWRLTAANGKIVADSGESYIRRYDAKIAATCLGDIASGARLEVADR